MHDARVKMKDGREYFASLWSFRPTEGWFSICDNDAPEKIFFRDVESAVNFGVRVHALDVRDVDLLERARREGWDGT